MVGDASSAPRRGSARSWRAPAFAARRRREGEAMVVSEATSADKDTHQPAPSVGRRLECAAPWQRTLVARSGVCSAATARGRGDGGRRLECAAPWQRTLVARSGVCSAATARGRGDGGRCDGSHARPSQVWATSPMQLGSALTLQFNLARQHRRKGGKVHLTAASGTARRHSTTAVQGL